MFQRIIVGLGAGVASAILFVVPVKGTFLAALFGVAAPLPLMIAFLGFSQTAGFAGSAVGIAVVAALLHPIVSGIFAVWLVLPVAVLSALAVRRRTGAGLVVAAAAGVSILLALGLIGFAIWSYGGWTPAVDAVTDALNPWVTDLVGGRSLPDKISPTGLARVMVSYAPAMAAGWTALTLCINFWIAGRLSLASNLLPRAWPNVPDTLRLPRLLGLAFAVALGCCFVGGPAGIAAACVAAGLGAAFALQGLGALHAITRGASARPAILGGAYAMVVGLMPWPLALAAGLGLVDCFAPLPRKSASPVPEL